MPRHFPLGHLVVARYDAFVMSDGFETPMNASNNGSVEEVARRVLAEANKVISGQGAVLEQLMVALFSNGHVLLEGVPGLGKTLLVRTLSEILSLQYGRIQFTPDMMPSDVTGTMVFDPKDQEFHFRKGPLFVGLMLADEINRTPPKTQAALLEAMEERRVTIDGVSHPLPEPFLVFATDNPIEFEGTYPLPEAQQDRFALKVTLTYPEASEEIEVLRRHHAGFRPQSLQAAGVQRVLDLDQLKAVHEQVRATSVEDKVFNYIYSIVKDTRESSDILVGGSPRAGIALLNCGKALAQIRGRNYVIPDDIKALALPVLRHRIQLRPEAEIEGLTPDDVLNRLLEQQTVPR